MKRNTFLHASTLTVLAVLTLAACPTWAQVSLDGPTGLAVDSKGNLYVANQSDSRILVYTNFVPQPQKTITAGVNHPTGVAFDSKGNLYVTNYESNNVTLYDSNGKQKTSATISYNVSAPIGVSVDSFNNVWVDNAARYVTMYSPFGTYLGSSTPGIAVDSIATHGAWYVLGSQFQYAQYPTGEVLTNGGIAGMASVPTQGYVLSATFDNLGNYYVGQDTGEVDKVNLSTGVISIVVPAGNGGAPWGLAVDSVHGLVYFSDINLCEIFVYSTSGQYITTF